MKNLRMWKLVMFRVIVPAFVSAALTGATIAQIPRQLLVEVGPNQEVKIFANDVSYGDVLRALEKKLGWEIEIPPLADSLKVSYVRIDPAQSEIAFAKFLEGSRLGYAFSGGAGAGPKVKVIVIASNEREATVAQGAPSQISENTTSNSPTAARVDALTSTQPNPPADEATPAQPEAPATTPLAEAADAIGVPPGASPADVGRAVTFAIADAASVVGVPPGMSPADVGKAVTFSISDAAKIVGVPPGMEPGDVGKTLTFPLLNGPAKRP